MQTRIAILFDSDSRPDTTGTYCLRALKELAQSGRIDSVDHIHPQRTDNLSRGAYDLFIWIDDGHRYDIPAHLKPNAFWVIDSHMKPEWSVQQAAKFDFVFTAQKDGVDLLRETGVPSVEWLPLACDPEIHSGMNCEKTLDFSFVGHIGSPERAQLIGLLKSKYPNHFVGNRFFREMTKTYAASRIVFNRSVKNDVNMRVFEALASGSLLLTNDLASNGLNELFQPGKHLVTYSSSDRLLAHMDWYLSNSESRDRIAQEGQREVLKKHTYRHRMQRLLDVALDDSLSKGVHLPAKSDGDGTSPVRRRFENSPGSEPLVSIVIVTFNQWEHTHQCLQSLREHTPEPVEIIVVDNASTDKTVERLRNWPDLHVVFNDQNLGFPAAVNQGIKTASGRYLLLINNDVVVADNWLQPMLNAIQSSPNIGIVGPCTNNTAGYQKIDVEYQLREFDAFAADWQQQHGETMSLVDEVMGFCMLIDRRVIEKIGLFDENYGIGCYEDNDFCMRARYAGFQAVIANGSFVHHHGHASFEAAGIDQQELATPNRVRFMKKWQDLRAGGGDEHDTVSSEGVSPRLTNKISHDTPNGSKDVRPEIQVKDASYFSYARPEILDLVPTSAGRILDIGCGTGRLGHAIKQRQRAVVTGIELSSEAAQQAANCLDEVFTVNIETNPPPFDPESFDCVVCGDVLEHMRDPHAVLKLIRNWLSPDGVLITSLPNTRHHSVISSLLAGNWTYEPSGLLDSDHVRFFTRREIEKLFYRAGFEVLKRSITTGADHSRWQQQGRPKQIQVGPLQIRCQTEQEAEEFYTYQWLHTAKPALKPNYGLTSIVIVTFNQWDYTRRCLESIRFRTDAPYELIVVDNGSTDGTPDFLKHKSDVHLISNASNRGFPAAVNQGLRVARGENILLLNNDVIVTTGWLERQLASLHSSESIGLVGPVSNNVSGPQQVPGQYNQLEELDGFAWDWGHHHRQHQQVDRLVGFCLLLKRSVLETIGELDEQFGVGCFEDDDYCRRARAAGFSCVIARDAFVHHFGSVSFRGSGQNLGEILRTNQTVYDRKWSESDQEPKSGISEPKHDGRNTGDQSPEPSSERSVEAKTDDVRLSACLIVRDNERTIRPCLESLMPWMDEVIVVDTGSNDKTPDIAEELGARVFHWEWRDDFSAARNQSLQHARGEWIFWMDSDDTLPDTCGQQLRELALGHHDDQVLGYVVQVHCPGGPSENDVTVVDHVKLIRNHPDIRFEFRIHEQVIPSIRRLQGKVEWTDLHVVHSGSDQSHEGRERKRQRDFRLLELELRDRPEHPFVLFNLGMTHADAENYSEAANYLERSLKVTGPGESHLRKVYSLLTQVYSQLQQYDQAMRVCDTGREQFPDDKELLFRQAMLLQQSGRLAEAATAYERVLSESSDRHFSSVDQGITGYKTRHNLALIYESLGDTNSAEQQWHAIVEEHPEYRPAWRALAQSIIAAQNPDQLRWIEDRLKGSETLQSEWVLFQAKQFEAAGDIATAIKHLEDVAEREPKNHDYWNEICRMSFSTESPQKVIERLQQLRSLSPEDPAVYYNLGMKYTETQAWTQAEQVLTTSLKLRPHHEPTKQLYEDVVQHILSESRSRV